jgi:hypothetical protein
MVSRTALRLLAAAGALLVVNAAHAQEGPEGLVANEHYVDKPGGAGVFKLPHATEPNPDDVECWYIKLYRSGVGAGGNDNWGTIFGKTSADVLQELRNSQRTQRQVEKWFPQQGLRSMTYFNPYGPIARLKRANELTRSEKLIQLSSKLSEMTSLFRQAQGARDRVLGKNAGGRNPFDGIGTQLKAYSEGVLLGTQQAHQAGNQLAGWTNRALADIDRDLDTALADIDRIDRENRPAIERAIKESELPVPAPARPSQPVAEAPQPPQTVQSKISTDWIEFEVKEVSRLQETPTVNLGHGVQIVFSKGSVDADTKIDVVLEIQFFDRRTGKYSENSKKYGLVKDSTANRHLETVWCGNRYRARLSSRD